MRTEQLYYALKVSEAGSYYKAAKALFITHQSLRKAIKTLEAELGCTIFAPTKRGVAPTPKGLLYLEQFSVFIALYEGLKSETFIQKQLEEQQTFYLGLNAFARHLLYKPYHGQFARQYPSLRTLVTEADAALPLLDRLMQQTLDLVLCTRQDHLCADEPAIAACRQSQTLKFIPLLPITITAQVQPQHPLLAKAQPTLDDLLAYPIIDGSPLLITPLLQKRTRCPHRIASIATADLTLLAPYITEQNAICWNAASPLSAQLIDYGAIPLVPLPLDILTSDLGVFYLDDGSPKRLLALAYIRFLQEKLAAAGLPILEQFEA